MKYLFMVGMALVIFGICFLVTFRKEKTKRYIVVPRQDIPVLIQRVFRYEHSRKLKFFVKFDAFWIFFYVCNRVISIIVALEIGRAHV